VPGAEIEKALSVDLHLRVLEFSNSETCRLSVQVFLTGDNLLRGSEIERFQRDPE
jgi:hypothetical protein